MKKFLLIGLIVALVFILAGGAGLAYAQIRNLDNNPAVTVNTNQNGNKIVRQYNYGPGGMMGWNDNEYGYGPGGMMGRRGIGPGMMGERGIQVGRGVGIMHDYMITAFANAVGLTVDDINTRLANGETPKEIAAAQGITGDKWTTLVTQVRKAALDQAVADGVITQAQADLMLERMNQYSGDGFGPGFGACPMWDGDETR